MVSEIIDGVDFGSETLADDTGTDATVGGVTPAAIAGEMLRGLVAPVGQYLPKLKIFQAAMPDRESKHHLGSNPRQLIAAHNVWKEVDERGVEWTFVFGASRLAEMAEIEMLAEDWHQREEAKAKGKKSALLSGLSEDAMAHLRAGEEAREARRRK